jgi:hypothetical protein
MEKNYIFLFPITLVKVIRHVMCIRMLFDIETGANTYY